MSVFYWVLVGLLLFVVVTATVTAHFIVLVLAGCVLLGLLVTRPEEL